MKIAVTAPSGNVGRHVVHDLVLAGVRPRVLAHRPESLDPALRDHVDLRIVDLGSEADVVEALRGVDALYLTVPPNEAKDPVADYARVGGVVSAAVSQEQVTRVVLQSSVGAEKRHGAGEIDGLARVEEQLDASGTSVTHLRCGFFFSNLLLMLDQVRSGTVSVVLPTHQPMAWVAPADIARVASFHLLNADWSGRRVRALQGPEDLSWDAALAIVSGATGHPVRAQRITDDEMRAALSGAGMGDGLVEAVLGMSTGLRDGFVPEQPRDATTTTGTTLAAWAHAVLRPALEQA